MPQPSVNAAFPAAKADLCVKCGLCLPHCPTYRETQHEAESPRGRIALMQGLAGGQLLHTPRLQAHLDACLGCRSCERVCPAQVPYGELIDAGRALLAAQRGAPQLTRLLSPWLLQRSRRWLARMLLLSYQHSGLQTLIRSSRLLRGRWARWESLIPARHDDGPGVPLRGAASSAVRPLPELALFRGCVGDIADGATLATIRQLFEHCGFTVQEPQQQGCCGALHQHAGLGDTARMLARRNTAAFAEAAGAADTAIVYAASGCGATLHEYGHIGDDEACAGFARRVREPHALLLQNWPDGVRLQALRAKVAVHLPCTQRNVTGGSDALIALLKKIPELEILPLDLQNNCCGAAGTYFLSEPEMADRLLDHKLDALARLRPDYLLSGNIGCTLHLAAGLRRRGLRVPVLHPLALVARQWPTDR